MEIITDTQWRHYNLVMVMLQYVLPLSAVTFTYGHMAKVSMKSGGPGQWPKQACGNKDYKAR